MEIPEKIYLTHNENEAFVFTQKRTDNKGIEYTTIDTFLEKAENFFENNLTEEDCKFGSSEWTEVRTEYDSINSFIRAFRNYMKG